MKKIVKKIIPAIAASLIAITGSTFCFTANATFDDSGQETQDAAQSDISEPENPVEPTEGNELNIDGLKSILENSGIAQAPVQSSPNNGIDYYEDDYYDTDGNATLIKSERIIYNSEEMQFIAVTTKDGHVFYVLINYAAEGNEDNVYFLNKVDAFDLYSLLYTGNENEEESNDPALSADAAKNAADSAKKQLAENVKSTAPVMSATAPVEVSETEEKVPYGGNTMILFAVGIIVLAVGGFIFFKIAKSNPKNKKSPDTLGFDDEFDDITTDEEDE